MADSDRKLPENVPGKWYVDDSCTPCRVCLEEAPNLIRLNEDETYTYFFRQPANAQENAEAQRAMDVCPTLAIGNDGDEILADGDIEQEPAALPSHQKESPAEFKAVPSSTPVSDKVTFAAFSPPSVYPGLKFLIDVWAHTEPQSSEVARLAAEIRRPEKLGVKSGISLERGSVLAVILQIPEMLIPDPNEVLVWDGVPTNASFIVEVPGNATLGDYPGKATITAAGLPVAKLSFCIPVTAQEAHNPVRRLGALLKQPRTAFASYASRDRGEVMARVQGMKKINPDLDIFLDVLSLRAGQRWEEQLFMEIPAREVFFLFWSVEAAESPWVEREWRCALATRGLESIDPVPLSDPRHAPPPEELSALHFNDYYAAFSRAEAAFAQSPLFRR